ncbi:dihydrodipicolinate synthase family protein [Kribbella qitaiheensis]|uniref:Dihydrodipicolinate synthase family protein n=1 Tax=Kribbella qitaiheensis TaxID=1544730 RepID=A0A7G6X1K8_9ACTN|nr:dihydrodipicolinate synthase family protein [Kribbella qitaiheensis]QNE20123.1 dihydrodipicolinate synthase family protein [Kribbella qitaiheensis]
MSLSLRLPLDGGLETYQLTGTPIAQGTYEPATSRLAFAAAHVVADPLGDNSPGAPAAIDWEHTLAFRQHLWSLGLSVAEAMDTAQRGMGLDWPATKELIRRSAAEAPTRVSGAGGGSGAGGASGARGADGADRASGAEKRIAVGVGTDQLGAGVHPLDAVIAAYEEQLALAEEVGAQPILMASRALCAAASSSDDYRKVYDRLLSQSSRPVILHWLGSMFDPALDGYWGSDSLDTSADVVVDLIAENAAHVDGIKVSLLDASKEIALRKRLPEGIRLYTGDDFNYPELIQGDGEHHSDALLGIFAAIAPAAAAALKALDDGDLTTYEQVFAPTVPLARQIFSGPTYYYKTGIAFLAWLNGHQPGFGMVGGLQTGRSLPHLADTFRLADAAGVLTSPELAVDRFRKLLIVGGVDA